jgi:hypothetical protein
MATHRTYDGLVRVERAGAEVAINDPKRRQCPRGGERPVRGRSCRRRTTCRGSIHLLSPSIGGAERIGPVVEGCSAYISPFGGGWRMAALTPSLSTQC